MSSRLNWNASGGRVHPRKWSVACGKNADGMNSVLLSEGICMVVIVMGVTGAGKTTVGRALAAALGWEFHDADELHSEMAKRKMHLGIPLDDADRAPWLSALRKLILGMVSENRNGVVAC